jgi:1-acyl-sn-glycerol-3-phosphate acyltransferase
MRLRYAVLDLPRGGDDLVAPPLDFLVSALPLPASTSVIDRPLVRGLAAWLGASLLARAGWKVVLVQPVPARCVVIFYPHTSNWDTVIGLCLKFMTGLAFRFAGKDSLFRAPCLGSLLVRWGGVPVNRRERTGFIEQMEGEFRRNEVFRLAIAPEGTRGRTECWKSGFYHLARAAKVPLALAYIDYSTREIGVGGYLETTGDREADMARLRAFYRGRRGRHPGHQAPIRFRDDPIPGD